MWKRAERARQDGDTAPSMKRLYLAELVTKVAVSGMLRAAVDDR
jgi:hypothetical protein